MRSREQHRRMSAVELTADPAFARRIVRLAVTSAFVLGLIWLLSGVTLEAHRMIERGLVGGWLSMPSILGLSLRWPRLRHATIVPATLVCVALSSICATALPDDRVARTGWLLVTSGVHLGAVLGAWFWFRWIPVPTALSDPFSRGRWALIVVHVCLIVGGLTLVVLSI